MYTKKSIGRPDGGAGNPSPKSPTIIIVEAADIETYPARTVGTTTAAAGFKLKTGATAIGVYATPSSIEMLQEGQGDADAFGYLKGVKFEHPGNSSEIEDFIEYFSNKNTVAIVTGCDGGATRIVGSPCNPLSMKVETVDSKENNKSTITLQQAARDEFRILRYMGELPPVEGATASSEDA